MVESREGISLRAHLEELRRGDLEMIDRRFSLAEKAVTAALTAADKAVEKAEKASEKRADASNEIRQAMIDQQSTFVSKEALSGIERRVSIIEDFVSKSVGRAGGTASSSDLAFRVIAALAAIAGIAGVIYGLTK